MYLATRQLQNRLRLFDLDSVDSSIIEDGINFDKTDTLTTTLFPFHPMIVTNKGELLRIFTIILLGVKRCAIDHR